MTDKELLQEALYALTYVGDKEIYSDTIDALRARLAQPEREWVGLTDEAVRDLWSWSATSEAEKPANTQQHAFTQAIEAKLKDKNGY